MKKILFAIFVSGAAAYAGESTTVQVDSKAMVSVYQLLCADLTQISESDQGETKVTRATLLSNPINYQSVAIFADGIQSKLPHDQFTAEGCDLDTVRSIKSHAHEYYEFWPSTAKLTTSIYDTPGLKYRAETYELTLVNPEYPHNSLVLTSKTIGNLEK